MTQTIVDFETELYQEHLEEASFLYEQRLTLFDDPEITWLDIEDFEERFEAHIDALVVGEELALNVCKTQAMEGDFGELHAAVRVFCRQNRLDFVQECLEALDPEDTERVQAISDALNHELPTEWKNEFVKKILDGDEKLIPVLANVAGYRRLPAGKELIEALPKGDPASLPTVIRALGRLREQNARSLLLNYLQHEDEAICSAATLALLRMGEQQAINHCLSSVQSQSWTFIPLALGGSRSAIPLLLERAAGEKVDTDCLMALGLSGDISAIDVLIRELSNEETADASAISLNLITGANLYEDAFIPEEIEEDELFEEEIEDFKAGKVPVRPDGEPFGIEITRTSQKPDEWQNWWEENKSRFDPNVRYRNGKPYSPECLLRKWGQVYC